MVYVFLANGFEEIEALTVVDTLRRASIDVLTVGIGELTVSGAHNIEIQADIPESEASFLDLDMIVLPGGMPGTLNLEKSTTVNSFIDYATEHDLWIAAICAAPSILGKKGLLNGLSATCYPGCESFLYGAKLTNMPVVKDKTIITAKSMGTALDFSLELVSVLKGRSVASDVEESLCRK